MVAGGAIGGRSTPRRRWTSAIQACFWYVYWCALVEPALDDADLEVRVGPGQLRVGAQGVPEARRRGPAPPGRAGHGHGGGTWSRRRTDGADQHRPRWRPRIRSGLRPEAELEKQRGDDWNVIGRGRDREIDDALAGQAGNGRAADVLDDEVRAALPDHGRHRCGDVGGARVPGQDGRGQDGHTDRVRGGLTVECNLGPCDRSSAGASSRWTSAKSPA